ncbi:hypothetical protein M752DRAFT_141175 [Aspergillus phoenicis ATCC 13157]|uniref:Uncharacterized protein n=1 Tax=Aspergillus phoenicis ATCC 13157 TaxID=1353007 RepID=A0A370PQR6_ASPPH|nr:hypothetical protein M752DRAFT_141175 [Aspergillus phoenicis ATCC 13157]
MTCHNSPSLPHTASWTNNPGLDCVLKAANHRPSVAVCLALPSQVSILSDRRSLGRFSLFLLFFAFCLVGPDTKPVQPRRRRHWPSVHRVCAEVFPFMD